MDSILDQRCKRTGRSPWRCNQMAMPGRSLCEKHQLQRDVRNQRIKELKRAGQIKLSANIADRDVSGKEIILRRAGEDLKRRKNSDDEEEDDDEYTRDEGRMVWTLMKRECKLKDRCGGEGSGNSCESSGESVDKQRISEKIVNYRGEKHTSFSKSLVESNGGQRNSGKNRKDSGLEERQYVGMKKRISENGMSKLDSSVLGGESGSWSGLSGDIAEWRIPLSRRDGTVEMVPIPRAPDMPELVFPGAEHVPLDCYRKLAEVTFSVKRMYQRHYFEHQGEREEWEAKMAQLQRENDELRLQRPPKS